MIDALQPPLRASAAHVAIKRDGGKFHFCSTRRLPIKQRQTVRYVNKTPFGCQYEEFASSPIREPFDQSGGGVGGSGKGGIGGAGGEGGAGGIGGAGIGGQGSMNDLGETAFGAVKIKVEWQDILVPIQLVRQQSVSVSDPS